VKGFNEIGIKKNVRTENERWLKEERMKRGGKMKREGMPKGTVEVIGEETVAEVEMVEETPVEKSEEKRTRRNLSI